jgi:hypothetical protein
MDEDGGLFEYAPLPTASSIRLLEIHGEEGGLFSCSIETLDLDDRPIYNCLSCTWGDPDPVGATSRPEAVDYIKWPTYCNNRLLFVAQSLFDAIRRLYHSRNIIAGQPDSCHQTRLHGAAATGKVDLIKHLLHTGADIFSQDVDERTPIDGRLDKATRKFSALCFVIQLVEAIQMCILRLRLRQHRNGSTFS